MALKMEWCLDPTEADRLGHFFSSNVSPAYISHSELQSDRTTAAGNWSPALRDIVADEVRACVASPNPGSGKNQKRILVARGDGQLLGMSIVSFTLETPKPFATVEDLLVAENQRGKGAGQAILAWIEQEALRIGCAAIFLESGLHNSHAHAFFERDGFHSCSIVMKKDLGTMDAIDNKSSEASNPEF